MVAQNELCPIQALAVELPSGSLLFGTQYHPEFTLSVAAGLIEMRSATLVAEGFGRDCAELVIMARDFRALHSEPERRDLAWRYGIGSESWILSAVRLKSATGCGKRPRFPAHDITKSRATLRQIDNPPPLTSAWLKRERPQLGASCQY